MDLLRDEVGFQGYVVSDCGAIRDFYTGHGVADSAADAAALGELSGTDLNCGNVYPVLTRAVEQGLISEENIDVSVKRLMLARMKLGMFDPDETVPWNDIPYDVVDCEKHRRLALETARKSIVLLKNDNSLLPLSETLGKIAVIGPNSDDVEVLNANYNGIPTDPVTPLQGIIDKAGKENVLYAPGCVHVTGLPVMEAIPSTHLFTDKDLTTNGLTGEYFGNGSFEDDPVETRIDSMIDFYWWDDATLENLDDDDFSIRWTGYIVPPASGEYALGGEGMNGFSIFLEDSLLVRFNSIHHALKRYQFIELEADKAYRIRIDYYEEHGDASMKLLWSVPGNNLEKEALEAAGKADAVILFMGLSPRLEGEEMRIRLEGFYRGDRTNIQLPEIQQNLIKKIQSLNKPTVLVLLSGSALAVNWEDENIPAIIEGMVWRTSSRYSYS